MARGPARDAERPARAAPRVLLGVCLLLAFAPPARGAAPPALYRDLTRPQDSLAQAYLTAIYSARSREAQAILRRMRNLEGRRDLPPLSYLLEVATHVTHLQNGDVPAPIEEQRVEARARNIGNDGLRLCERGLRKSADHPTYLFIKGGILGFLATLLIHDDVTRALTDGFEALKLLEKAAAMDGNMQDCYLGTGIFHCTTAGAPFLVRATLKLFGRSVSMPAGLRSLRASAYHGRYTNVQGQLFLIRFLSPYDDELRREKGAIFTSLERNFKGNPYFTFQKHDEALSFYPDRFFRAEVREDLARRIPTLACDDFASCRYLNLVKLQYGLLDPNPPAELRPDPELILRDFGYYPVFMEALRLKRVLRQGPASADREAIRKRIGRMRDSCLSLIEESELKSNRKRYYRWHVDDALR